MRYQITTVPDNTRLIIGNAKIEYAVTTVGGTYVSLGAGVVTSFKHDPTFYESQAGNSPDPIQGVGRETCSLEMELIEYSPSSLSAISGALYTYTSGSTGIITAGGKDDPTMTPKIFRVTNTRYVSTATYETIITIYRGFLNTGISFPFKSDNDTDPVMAMPITILGKVDTTLSAGSQLFKIETDVVG